MTNDTTKILIDLDWNLEIYEIDDLNQSATKPKKLAYNLKRGDLKVLNLDKKFEEIWKWLEIRYLVTEVYFCVKDKASFSDSRVIYIWLKTWQMFNPDYKFYLSYNDSNINSDKWILNPVQLTYLHEVRIGKVITQSK
jgi:hypothetical protein